MNTPRALLHQAAEILRLEAGSLLESHNPNPKEPRWEFEPDAKAAYDHMIETAAALCTMAEMSHVVMNDTSTKHLQNSMFPTGACAKHVRTGREYTVLHVGKMKADGDWIPCVVYRDNVTQGIYTRSQVSFSEKFQLPINCPAQPV